MGRTNQRTRHTAGAAGATSGPLVPCSSLQATPRAVKPRGVCGHVLYAYWSYVIRISHVTCIGRVLHVLATCPSLIIACFESHSLADTRAGPSILANELLKRLPKRCLREVLPVPTRDVRVGFLSLILMARPMSIRRTWPSSSINRFSGLRSRSLPY